MATAGDIPQCSVCGRYIYTAGHECVGAGAPEPVYRVVEHYAGSVPFVPPIYRVTRSVRRTGIWPFRRQEYEYVARSDFSTMTMSAEVYCRFKAHFAAQIVEDFSD